VQFQCIDTLYIHRLVQYFDFGLPDTISVKRRSRQLILGPLMSGSYLRFHETNNLSLCVRLISPITPNNLYHPPVFDSIRIRIMIRHVYIAL